MEKNLLLLGNGGGGGRTGTPCPPFSTALQNIWNKVKESSKTEHEQKTLITASAKRFAVITKVFSSGGKNISH